MDNSRQTEEAKLAYIRQFSQAMNEVVIPRLMQLEMNDLLAISIELSLLSPVVQGLDSKDAKNRSAHELIGLGCAALQLMAASKMNAMIDTQISN